MAERMSWEQVKGARRDTRERGDAYREAREAFDLGERVRSERERVGLTQAELAELMDTTQPTVARLEAGGVLPTLETLQRVADALDLELVVDFRRRNSA